MKYRVTVDYRDQSEVLAEFADKENAELFQQTWNYTNRDHKGYAFVKPM